jgi:outer membrane lipoprotein carrier protein
MRVFFLLLVAGMNTPLWAAESTALDQYLNGLKTLRAEFSQVLVDAKEQVVERSSGELLVARPGKFRWEISGEVNAVSQNQLLIADGRNLWFYDRELEQVTVKPADATLSATPAMLLSGEGNLNDSFKISALGPRDALNWVLVEPQDAAADFHRALLGFDNQNELQRMIIDDKLGQTATVTFRNPRRNAPVAPGEVSFTPPAGVDVIGAAQQ